MRNEAKANATATARPLALPLSFSLWFLPKVFARFETPGAASTSTASVLLPPSCVFGLLFWFYTFSNYAHTNKHTNMCMCVRRKRKKLLLLLSLFTAITSLRSIRKNLLHAILSHEFTVLVTFCRGRAACASVCLCARVCVHLCVIYLNSHTHTCTQIKLVHQKCV